MNTNNWKYTTDKNKRFGISWRPKRAQKVTGLSLCLCCKVPSCMPVLIDIFFNIFFCNSIFYTRKYQYFLGKFSPYIYLGVYIVVILCTKNIDLGFQYCEFFFTKYQISIHLYIYFDPIIIPWVFSDFKRMQHPNILTEIWHTNI